MRASLGQMKTGTLPTAPDTTSLKIFKINTDVIFFKSKSFQIRFILLYMLVRAYPDSFGGKGDFSGGVLPGLGPVVL